jgi:hypothetical protein
VGDVSTLDQSGVSGPIKGKQGSPVFVKHDILTVWSPTHTIKKVLIGFEVISIEGKQSSIRLSTQRNKPINEVVSTHRFYNNITLFSGAGQLDGPP